MSYILNGSIYKDNQEQKLVDVASSYLDVGITNKLDVRPPKIIVGLSITLLKERECSPIVRSFPAVLDTGFNKTLEIDQRLLDSWAGIKHDRLRIATANKSSDYGPLDERLGNIWLHCGRYVSPYGYSSSTPFHLENSSVIRVMHPVTNTPSPRMPLLGLRALIDNNLHIKLNTTKGTFCLYHSSCSWRAWFH